MRSIDLHVLWASILFFYAGMAFFVMAVTYMTCAPSTACHVTPPAAERAP